MGVAKDTHRLECDSRRWFKATKAGADLEPYWSHSVINLNAIFFLVSNG